MKKVTISDLQESQDSLEIKINVTLTPGDTHVGEQGALDPSSELKLLEEPNGIVPVFSDPEGVADGSELKRSLQRRRERGPES